MKKIILLLALCLTAITTSAQRLFGGDISVLPNYEKDGTVYRDSGRKVQFMDFVKTEGGWNAIRVRLFVDPENAPESAKKEGVCQDINYIIPLCKQVKAAGMKLMLDFHYSDTWADPPSSTHRKHGREPDGRLLPTPSMPSPVGRFYGLKARASSLTSYRWATR